MTTYTIDLRKTQWWPLFELVDAVADLECDVDAVVDFEPGFDPDVTIKAIRIGSLNVLTSPCKLHRDFGDEVRGILEQDADWQAEQIREAGITYVGRGANDPDGRFARVAA